MSLLTHMVLGWRDKVDSLVRALLSLEGLCVTNKQVREIKLLYDDLPDIDKNPLSFQSRAQRPRGRFARTKTSRSGHVGITAMRKYFFHLVCFTPCFFMVLFFI